MGKVKRLLSRMYNAVAVIDSVKRPCSIAYADYDTNFVKLHYTTIAIAEQFLSPVHGKI